MRAAGNPPLRRSAGLMGRAGLANGASRPKSGMNGERQIPYPLMGLQGQVWIEGSAGVPPAEPR